jgi:hypothetical protein
MRRSIKRTSMLAAVAVMAAAGCGSSHKKATPSQEQQVRQVLRSYLQAQTSGDGQTACSLLTGAAQTQLETLVLQAGKGLITTRPSCPDAVGLVHAVAGQKLLAALASARIGQVQLQGDQASAEVIDGTTFGQQRVSLQRSGGTWKITGVPNLRG